MCLKHCTFLSSRNNCFFILDHPLYSKPKRLFASKSSASAGFGYSPCDVIKSATTPSFQSCFKLCLDYTSCKSFSHSSTTKDCFVSSQDKKSCKDFVIDKTFMYFEVYWWPRIKSRNTLIFKLHLKFISKKTKEPKWCFFIVFLMQLIVHNKITWVLIIRYVILLNQLTVDTIWCI